MTDGPTAFEIETSRLSLYFRILYSSPALVPLFAVVLFISFSPTVPLMDPFSLSIIVLFAVGVVVPIMLVRFMSGHSSIGWTVQHCESTKELSSASPSPFRWTGLLTSNWYKAQ